MSRMVETSEFAQFVRRVIRAYGKRVAEGDEPELAEMVELLDQFESTVGTAVHGWLSVGRSWTDVGSALGVSRQAARRRWIRYAPEASGPPQSEAGIHTATG